jgi:hypothetical protein
MSVTVVIPYDHKIIVEFYSSGRNMPTVKVYLIQSGFEDYDCKQTGLYFTFRVTVSLEHAHKIYHIAKRFE